MILLYDNTEPSRAYYGTDTRASQLLVGALLAIVLTKWAPRTRGQRAGTQVAGVAAAAFCLWAFTSTTDRDAWLYHGGFLLFAVATAFVIVAVIQPERGPVARALSFGPVRWVGQISYGLYLWHWPVQVALSEARTGIAGWKLGLVRLVMTFGAATLSYYLVEMPIRRGALPRRVARAAAPLGFVAVTLVALVATANATTPPAFLTASPDSVLPGGAFPTGSQPAPGTLAADLGRVLLLGDSVAYSLGDSLSAEATTRGIAFGYRARPGCGMILGIPTEDDGSEIPWGKVCEDDTTQYLSGMVQANTPDVVLWMSSWETKDRIIDGTRYDFGTRAADRALLREFETTWTVLTVGGADIVIVANAPKAERSETTTGDPRWDRQLLHLNELYRTFAARHPDSVQVLELPDLVCPGGIPCPEVVDDVTLRPRDGIHYEGTGATVVAERFLDALIALRFGPEPAG